MNEEALRRQGWLARQDTRFQDAVLAAGRVRHYAPRQTVFLVGDPPGGTFGIVEGQLAISIAPRATGPHLAHVARAGWWFGEGCFLTGEPRRIGMEAITRSTLFYLSLESMERLATDHEDAIRRFGQMAMLNMDVALRAIDALLDPDPARRIATTLVGCTGDGAMSRVVISQTELGRLSNASRKVVNRTLGMFAERGWLSTGYGVIDVLDPEALDRFRQEG